MKILYATDGSRPSGAALELLMALGNRSAIDLTVVSVVDREPLIPAGYLVESEVLREVRAHAKDLVDQVVARLAAAGFPVRAEVAEGRAGQAIVHAAERGDHDLVVVGAGSHSWLGNLLLGSTSTYVLHAWPASVLVVHEAPRPERPVRVLVATDGSVGARDAASMLRVLAHPSRCEATVLSVAQVPYLLALGYPYAATVWTVPELGAELMSEARKHAEEAADSLRRAGFRADAVTTDGAPHHLILGEAEKGGYDLVVVGSRGHGPIRRSLLGSVSDAVARHAHAALVGRTPDVAG